MNFYVDFTGKSKKNPAQLVVMAKKKSASSANSSSASKPEESINFEDALAEVEAIVARLESGDLGLTESLGEYETGIKRLKQCHRLLAAAEQRVSVLAGFDADGNPITEELSELEVRGGAGRSKSVSAKSAPSARRSSKQSSRSDDGNDDALNEDKTSESVDEAPGLF
ncbi:exodeoxyribonuclease VII small subunit [Rubripirellula reticaptiva]|uniref:exodeoxyribonuclease VII small subunit n=1 Tax=Rubripirellula reticaptiva TaxID=2528013 RepID=UPI001C987794|nr:exodeoxyribonuclease VII small subunit [Rubripirellula reticaptiva]